MIDDADDRSPDALLEKQSGLRSMLCDDLMYRVPADQPDATTFRLQLFASSAGLRPVAVAIQDDLEGGVSFINGCETFAAAVWRAHFRDEPMPPLWVQRTFYPQFPERQADDLWSGWELLIFQHGANHEVSEGRKFSLSQEQLDTLVGVAVTAERGCTFARQSRLLYRLRYELVSIDEIPAEKPFRAPGCMRDIGSSEPQDLGAGRDCCWYHSGDWASVTTRAVRLIAQAESDGAKTNYALIQYVLAAAKHEGVTRWDLKALRTLLDVPIVLIRGRNREVVAIQNGQHRIRAMRDAGLDNILVGTNPEYFTEDEP